MSKTFKKYNNRKFKNEDYDEDYINIKSSQKGRDDWKTQRKKIVHTNFNEDDDYLEDHDNFRFPRR